MTQWTDYPGDLRTWLATCSRCGKETAKLLAELEQARADWQFQSDTAAHLFAELELERADHGRERDSRRYANILLTERTAERNAERAKVKAVLDLISPDSNEAYTSMHGHRLFTEEDIRTAIGDKA